MATKSTPHNIKAPKQTVGAEVARCHAERVKAEILQDIAACNEYCEKHDSFADMVREHYARENNDE